MRNWDRNLHVTSTIFLNNFRAYSWTVIYTRKFVSTQFGVLETLIAVDEDNQCEFAKIFVSSFSREIYREWSKTCQRPPIHANQSRQCQLRPCSTSHTFDQLAVVLSLVVFVDGFVHDVKSGWHPFLQIQWCSEEGPDVSIAFL